MVTTRRGARDDAAVSTTANTPDTPKGKENDLNPIQLQRLATPWENLSEDVSCQCVSVRDEKMTESCLAFMANNPDTIDFADIAKLLTSSSMNSQSQFWLMEICSKSVSMEISEIIMDHYLMDEDYFIARISFFSPSILVRTLLQILVRTPLRAGSRLVLRVVEQQRDVIGELLKAMQVFETAVVAFFVVQIFSFAAIKQVMDNGPHPASLAILAAVVGSDDRDLDPRILPARLFPVSKKHSKKIISCESCPTTSFLSESLLCDSDLFRCKICSNLFSSKCSTCGSCPVEGLCWGCGYRTLAALVSPGVARSTDPYLIATCLVLGELKSSGRNFFSKFVLEISPPDWITPEIQQALLSPCNDCVPPFRPSREFSFSLIRKLAIGEKQQKLRSGIVKAVLMLETFTVGAFQVLNKSSQIGIDDSLLGSVVLNKIRNTSPAIINAGLHFLSTRNCAPIDKLMHFMSIEKKLSLAGKEILFSKIFPDSLLSNLLDYLIIQCSESESKVLFDILFVRHEAAGNMIKFVEEIRTSVVLTDLFEKREKIDPILTGIVYHSHKIPFETRIACIEFLVNNNPRNIQWLVPVIMQQIISQSDLGFPSLLLSGLEILRKVENLPESTVLWNKLAGFIQTQDSLVSRASVLLMVRLAEGQARYQEMLSLLVDNCLASATLRACWLVGSILENDQGIFPFEKSRKITLQITEWIYSETDNIAFVSVLGFIARNPRHREFLLSDARFLNLIQNSTSVIHGILKSALQLPSDSSACDRPSAGVSCRPLAQLVPALTASLLSANSDISSLKSLDIMQTIGIANPRNLPPIYLARYVLPCDDEDLQNCARLLFESKFRDFRNINYLLSNLLTLLADRNEDISYIGARFWVIVGRCFKKEEIKSAIGFFTNFLKDNDDNELIQELLNSTLKHSEEGNLGDKKSCKKPPCRKRRRSVIEEYTSGSSSSED